MALYCWSRLGSKQVFTAINKVPNILASASYAQAASVPKISFKAYQAPVEEHYDVKNARLSRPMSPHLTIYKPQLTSILSITHRITGMMLTGYATVLGVGVLVLPHDVSHYLTMIEGLHLSAASIFLAKSVIAFPFGYHLANGFRHLYWDTGKGLTIKEVYASGYTMLALATIISFGLAMM